jgi:hypothetical protein
MQCNASIPIVLLHPPPDAHLLGPPLLSAKRKTSHLSLVPLCEVVREQVEVLFACACDRAPETVVLLLASGSSNALVKSNTKVNVCFADVGVLVVHAADSELAETGCLLRRERDVLCAADLDERGECA